MNLTFTHSVHGEIIKPLRISECVMAMRPSTEELQQVTDYQIRKLCKEAGRAFEHMDAKLMSITYFFNVEVIHRPGDGIWDEFCIFFEHPEHGKSEELCRIASTDGAEDSDAYAKEVAHLVASAVSKTIREYAAASRGKKA